LILAKCFFLGGAFKWGRLFLILAVSSYGSSCAVTPHLNQLESPRLIQQVPFFPQEAFQCGPASLASLLNYWGIPVTPEDIALAIYSPSAKGTLTIDLILYAEKKGLKANNYKSSVKDIRDKIDSGFPLIVMVDYGFWMVKQNHFMVVLGYDNNVVVAHSGRERLKVISLKDFMKTWGRTKFWTLLITPQR
jgi:ABC-type bacteriocin/lantibiotic exporter with double-glycine peptidase domain